MRLFAAQVIKDHRSGEDDSGGGEEPSMSIRRLYENVIEWQSQRCTNSIPRRHFFADDEERRLAYRLAYYKSHALSQSRRPKLTLSQSRRPKLTKGDKALMNNIVGKALPGIPGEAHKRRLLSVADPWIRKLYNDVIEWQSQRCTNSIPSRHFFADDEERRLARRLSYALRSSRRPKLTEVDNSLLNIIPGILGRAPKGRQNGV